MKIKTFILDFMEVVIVFGMFFGAYYLFEVRSDVKPKSVLVENKESISSTQSYTVSIGEMTNDERMQPDLVTDYHTESDRQYIKQNANSEQNTEVDLDQERTQVMITTLLREYLLMYGQYPVTLQDLTSSTNLPFSHLSDILKNTNGEPFSYSVNIDRTGYKLCYGNRELGESVCNMSENYHE
jgi:hypothetical protein